MLVKMRKENSYAKMGKFGAQICKCTRHGLKGMVNKRPIDIRVYVVMCMASLKLSGIL